MRILFDREFANLYQRATKSKDKKNKDVIKQLNSMDPRLKDIFLDLYLDRLKAKH